MKRGWLTLLLATPPAVFLLLFLVLPFVSIARVAWPLGAIAAPSRDAIGFSLFLGAATMVLALAVGLPLAYLLGRHRFRGRVALRALVTVPFVVPAVVLAAGMIALVGPDVQGTLVALLLAHAVYNAPLVARLVGDTWAHLDPRLEEAAATLGAGPWRRFASVTLPRLLPAILASSLLAFVFGFTGFATVLLVGDPQEHATTEVLVYRLGVQVFDLRAATTLALVQVCVTALAALAYSRLIERAASRERPVDEAAALRPLAEGSRPLLALAFAMAGALVLPLLAVIVRAFRTPDGWGVGAFARVLTPGARGFYLSPLDALGNTILFAALTLVAALALGTLAAAAASRVRGAWLDALWMVPLGTSAVTLGLGLLIVFPWKVGPLEIDLRATAALLVIAHVLVAFPFVMRATVGPIRALDPTLGEAARTLGATRWQRLRRVHAPLLAPALLVGAVLAASVSLGEFGATLVLLRPEYATLPTEMARTLSTSRPDPWIFSDGMAMAAILLVADLAFFLAIERLRPGRSGGF